MPDIGFKLHGDASEFEKAVAHAKESVHELHHEVRGLNQTFRLGREVLAGFGLYEVFTKALDKAKAMREESEKNGTALDRNVAAAARLADQFDRFKEGVGSVSAKVIGGVSGFFTKIGDKLRGGDGNLDQTFDDEARGNNAEKERVKGEATRKKIAEEKEKDALREAKGEEKVNLLLKENIKLHADENKFTKLTSEYQEDEYAIEKNNLEIKKLLTEEGKEATEQAKKEAEERKKIADEIKRAKAEQAKKSDAQSERVGDAQAKLDEAKADRGKLSLGELAKIKRSTFGASIDAEDAGTKAREVQSLEDQANKKRLLGDVDGANELFSKADDTRKALGGFGHAKDVNPFEGLEKEVETQTSKLDEINSTLKGKFTSQ